MKEARVSPLMQQLQGCLIPGKTHRLPWVCGRRLHVGPHPLLKQCCSKAGVLCSTAGYKNALFLCELVQNVSVLGLVLLQGHSCAVTHALARQHPMASFAGDEIPTSLGRRVLGVCSWGKACTDNEKQKRSLPNFLSPKIRP